MGYKLRKSVLSFRCSSQFMMGVISSYAVVLRKELGSRCFNPLVVIFKNVGIYSIRGIFMTSHAYTDPKMAIISHLVDGNGG